MHDESRSGNIALLIDADNASPDHLDPVLTALAELGTVNIRRAYGNWAKPALRTWQAMTLRYAIEPQQQFDLTKGKNATDMNMTIDAMDLLHGGRVDGFGIMSSDSDFMPIASRIRQHGLPVYGFGRATTSEGFRQACTRFIDVEALGTPPADAPAPIAPADDAALVALLSNAIKASKRDEQGFASLSEVGKLAGNRSSFDARSYGAARLSDLVEKIPAFNVERRANGVYVRRLR
jgi:hypothetical protein